MRLALAAVALVVAVGPAEAASRPTQLLHEWDLANEACRDGSDGKAMDAACSLRDIIDRKLAAVGWCYGRPGQIEAEMDWHSCRH